jgi:cyclopropane fatty-acyl-phospholipid synthase-like methyltransferase
MFEPEDHLAPLTNELLRLAFRGLDLPPHPRVADLCCGTGSASRFFAAEFGAVCTGVDRNETLLRIGRERALAEGLQERVEFIQADARHVQLQSHGFDLVLAMGGALSYMGRVDGLERIRFLLQPGGALLLSDLVYQDSPVPADVARVIEDEAPGNTIRELPLEPAVRAVFEEGVFRFENEASYRALLELQGYDVRFAFPVPESAWNAYYTRAAASRDPSAELSIPVGADELAAIYCWGGRWGLGYLVCGAVAR